MVSITLSIPESVREVMKKFPEVNWSGFVRATIEEKTKKLAWKEEMLKKLGKENESGFTDWTIETGRKLKKDISKRHGL